GLSAPRGCRPGGGAVTTSDSIRTATRHAGGAVREWTSYAGIELPARYGEGDASREYVALRARCGLVDASWRSIIDLRGERAREVLGRVTSSRIEDVSAERGDLACLLSPKGRLLSAFIVLEPSRDHLRLVTFEPPREEIVRELTKYAFLDD